MIRCIEEGKKIFYFVYITLFLSWHKSVHERPLQFIISLTGEVRAYECQASPGMQDAAKETDFFLTPSRIIKSAAQGRGRKRLGEEQPGLIGDTEVI